MNIGTERIYSMPPIIYLSICVLVHIKKNQIWSAAECLLLTCALFSTISFHSVFEIRYQSCLVPYMPFRL